MSTDIRYLGSVPLLKEFHMKFLDAKPLVNEFLADQHGKKFAFDVKQWAPVVAFDNIILKLLGAEPDWSFKGAGHLAGLGWQSVLSKVPLAL